MQTVVLFHKSQQLSASANLFLIDESTLLIFFLERAASFVIECFFEFDVLMELVFFDFFFNEREGTENEFVEGFFFLGGEFGHAVDFELKEGERVFDVLDVSKL